VLDTPARRGTFDVDVGADELLSRSARWDAAGALVLE